MKDGEEMGEVQNIYNVGRIGETETIQDLLILDPEVAFFVKTFLYIFQCQCVIIKECFDARIRLLMYYLTLSIFKNSNI